VRPNSKSAAQTRRESETGKRDTTLGERRRRSGGKEEGKRRDREDVRGGRSGLSAAADEQL